MSEVVPLRWTEVTVRIEVSSSVELDAAMITVRDRIAGCLTENGTVVVE